MRELPEDERTERSLSLTTGGLTLLSVLLGIGVTVGLGIGGAWWIKLLAGVGTTGILVVLVKVGASPGRGWMVRLADWIIGRPSETK